MKNALLVPGVFFLSFLSIVIGFAFFGGIALRYELAVPFESGSGGLLLLCMVQTGCYSLSLAFMAAIIGVYTFLMRHQAKLRVALSLYLVCVIFTVTVIMPACYAQLPSVESAVTAYNTTAPDTALDAFLNKPLFLTLLRQGADSLFYDIYAAYTLNFATYLFFICAFFFCISSFWFVCTVTQWNMFNLLLLFLLSGTLVFAYPYTQQEGFRTALSNLHIMNAKNNVLSVSIIFCIVAVIFHSIGGLKMLLISSKTKKGAPHKHA